MHVPDTAPGGALARNPMTSPLTSRWLLFIVTSLTVVAMIFGMGILPAAHAAEPTSNTTSDTPFPGHSVAGDSFELSLRSVSPTTLSPNTALTVTVQITNKSDSALTDATMALEVGKRSLDSRTSQANWVRGTSSVPDRSSISSSVPTVAPGASTTVKLTLPADQLETGFTAATLPMRLALTRDDTTLASWRGTQPWLTSTQDITKIKTSLVVPVTLPSDPKLLTATGAERVAAWKSAIGPGSRIDKLLSSDFDTPVTWLIDPAVLDPSPAADPTLPRLSQDSATQQNDESSTSPSDEASSSPSPSSSSSTSPQSSGQGNTSVEAMAAALRQKLAQRPDSQQVWFLPYGDPDLSGLTSVSRPAGSQEALERTLRRELPDELKRISTTVVAAPQLPLNQASATRLRSAWTKARGTEPLILTPNVTVDGSAKAAITTAAHRSFDQGQFYGFDSGLSSLLDSTLGDSASAASSARAQTMAIYQERPSTQRSVLLMGDRAYTSADRLKAIASALDDSPWVDVTQAQASEASQAKPDVSLASRSADGQSLYPRARAQALSANDLMTISSALSFLQRISPSLENGEELTPAWSKTLDQLMSTRWRDHSSELTKISGHIKETIAAVPALVHVVPSQINFFTDSGKITVTVRNDLGRGVKNLHLTLTPRAYSLHIKESPAAFNVPAGSQAGVRVQTAAQSAGVVQVTTKLTGANDVRWGDSAAEPTSLTINARPTSSWIFWALGIVAFAVFCYGLFANRQRGTRRRDELARDIKL